MSAATPASVFNRYRSVQLLLEVQWGNLDIIFHKIGKVTRIDLVGEWWLQGDVGEGGRGWGGGLGGGGGWVGGGGLRMRKSRRDANR